MFKTIKKITSCFLALCMLLSIAPMGVFATETINYVSLGDSMANGYGLAGYQPAQGNVNGYRQEAPDAYPSQVATAKGWDLTQLAMSAMRAEDLNFILNFDWTDPEQVALVEESQSWNKDAFIANRSRWDEAFNCGDLYTWDEFVNGRFNDYNVINGAESGTAEYAKMFQNSVETADYVSMGIGNANFGVFMLGRITNAFGVLNGTPEGDAWIDFQDALSKLDGPAQAAVMEVYNNLTSYLSQQNYIAVEQAELLLNAVSYTVASYVLNYAEVIDRIVELKPDVNIILVGLMNTMSGSKMDFWGNEIDLGDILDIVIDTMNTYIAALPSAIKLTGNYTEATFYYAEEPHVEMIVSTLDDACSAFWTGNGYDVIRKRLVEDVCGGMVFDMVAPLFSNLGVTLDRTLTVADIEAFEVGDITGFSTDKIASCQVYLAFEEAIVDSTQIEVMDAEAVFSLADPAKLNVVFSEIGTQINPANIQASLITALTNNSTMKSLLNLFARHIIGNGIGSHPSAEGHDALTAAILDALENEYTTDNKIIDTATDLVEFIAKYGEDAVERAYAYLENEGYIAELETVVKNLIADLENPDSDLSQKIVSETDKLLAILEAETGEELPSGEEVITAIRNYEETLAELEEYIANNEEIQEAIAEVETIIAQINDIIANPEAYIQNIIDDVVAKYEEELEDATTAEYAICGENHYVAFAGTNTAGNEDYEYSYQVATYIDDEATSYHNFTDGTPIKDLATYITSLEGESLEALEDATIITYQTDAKDIVLPLLDGVDVADADWAALLDVDASKVAEIRATITTALTGGYAEEGTEAIENGIDKALDIKENIMTKLPEDWAATLVENGAKADEVIDTVLTTAIEIVNSNLDEEIVNIAAPYTEELVFNTVAYLINNIKSLEAIKAINPDALIAVVGLNNPVKGLTANINGEAINIGEYVEYFIEATNVYNTIYAAASENVIFVEADDAEIVGYQGAINIDTSNLSTIDNTLLQLLFNNSFANSTVVTEAGHNYIANQIKAAITLVDHIDEDGDDICDKCEENLAPATPSRPRPSGGSGNSVKEETPASAFKFTDVQSDKWYYDTVKKVVEKGLMNGISETKFAPELEVTRGMFVTILYRAAGEPEVSATTNFADVTTDKYYAKAVAWANANGIVKGITETEFAPDNNITREQMATILYRYAKNKAAAEVNYTDKDAISDYAMDAVAWAKAAGIMQGNADGTFAPVRNASRAEAAAVFVRMFKF